MVKYTSSPSQKELVGTDDLRVRPGQDRADYQPVGADLTIKADQIYNGAEKEVTTEAHIDSQSVGADLCVRPGPKYDQSVDNDHQDAPLPDLIRIIQWFKTMTTNAYIRGVRNDGWAPFPGKLWQRSFHDRIIRDRQELDRIRQYIARNPAKWSEDRENPAAGN